MEHASQWLPCRDQGGNVIRKWWERGMYGGGEVMLVALGSSDTQSQAFEGMYAVDCVAERECRRTHGNHTEWIDIMTTTHRMA